MMSKVSQFKKFQESKKLKEAVELQYNIKIPHYRNEKKNEFAAFVANTIMEALDNIYVRAQGKIADLPETTAEDFNSDIERAIGRLVAALANDYFYDVEGPLEEGKIGDKVRAFLGKKKSSVQGIDDILAMDDELKRNTRGGDNGRADQRPRYKVAEAKKHACPDCGNDPCTCRCEGEPLNEGNPITNTLSPSLDEFLADVAQMYGGIDYTDVAKFGDQATKDDLKAIRNLRRKVLRLFDKGADDEDVEVLKIMGQVAKIVKGEPLDEGCNGCLPDDDFSINECSYDVDKRYQFDNLDDTVVEEEALCECDPTLDYCDDI